MPIAQRRRRAELHIPPRAIVLLSAALWASSTPDVLNERTGLLSSIEPLTTLSTSEDE